MVQADTINQAHLAIDHFEPVVGDGISDTVSSIWIERGQCADRRTCIILSDSISIERQISWALIHIGHVDCERLLRTEAITVCRGDGQFKRSRVFVIKADAIHQAHFSVDHFKAIIRDRVSDRIPGIGIKGGQRTDNGTRIILCNGTAIEGQITRPFIHIRNTYREGLFAGQTTFVRCGDRDFQRLGGLVIQAHTIDQLQLAINHFKPIIGHGVGHGVPGIGIRR